jgi:hypothetical protein
MWTGLWIYFTAPPLAMLLASELYLRLGRGSRVYCAKLNHFNDARCIFRCRFDDMLRPADGHATHAPGAPRGDASRRPLPQETLYFG